MRTGTQGTRSPPRALGNPDRRTCRVPAHAPPAPESTRRLPSSSVLTEVPVNEPWPATPGRARLFDSIRETCVPKDPPEPVKRRYAGHRWSSPERRLRPLLLSSGRPGVAAAFIPGLRAENECACRQLGAGCRRVTRVSESGGALRRGRGPLSVVSRSHQRAVRPPPQWPARSPLRMEWDGLAAHCGSR